MQRAPEDRVCGTRGTLLPYERHYGLPADVVAAVAPRAGGAAAEQQNAIRTIQVDLSRGRRPEGSGIAAVAIQNRLNPVDPRRLLPEVGDRRVLERRIRPFEQNIRVYMSVRKSHHFCKLTETCSRAGAARVHNHHQGRQRGMEVNTRSTRPNRRWGSNGAWSVVVTCDQRQSGRCERQPPCHD